MKNPLPTRPNLLKIIQDNYNNKQKQLRKGGTPSSLRSQANMSNPSMDYMYDDEMFYNGGYISDRAKATQFGQYDEGGITGDPNKPYHPITNPSGYRQQNTLEKVKKLPNKEERYEPTNAVKNLKTTLAGASIASSGNPLTQYLAQVAGGTGDLYTAARYAADKNWSKAGEDAVQGVLGFIPYAKAIPGMKIGTDYFTKGAKLFNRWLKRAHGASDIKTLTESPTPNYPIHKMGGGYFPPYHSFTPPRMEDGGPGPISFFPQQDPEMIYADRFNTPLNKKETKSFNKWVAKESERQGRDIMMDKGAYDIQGFWKSGDYKKRDKDGHGTDTWKKPNHPTFSNQSKYHGVDGFYGGNWNPDGGYQPSKQSADMYGPSYYNRMFAEEPGRPEHLDASRFTSGANKPSPLYYNNGGDISIPNLNNDDMNIMDYMRYGGIYAYANGGNTKASIVDYLDAQGMASDKASRKKLAESMGIKNYTGSYDQNVEMVTRLNRGRYNPSQQAAQNPYITAPSPAAAPAQSGFGMMPRMSQPVAPAPRQAAPAPRTSKKPAVKQVPAQQQVVGQDSGFRPYSPEQLNQMYNFPGTLNFKKPATTAKQAAARKTKQANAEDQRNLESGMITDKGTNMMHVIKNGKIVNSFPVLTGQARDVNYNPYSVPTLGKNPSLRGTPVGTYFSKPDANLYGEKGFRMNPIPAFGQEAPVASNLAQHITFGQHKDPAEYRRREALYNQSPAARATSYGCTNCRKPDLDYIVNAFPQGDTTMVIDSRRIADANLLKNKFKKKEYGGGLYHYNPGGPILPGTLNTAVKEMMYNQSAASGVPPLLARPADQMDNFVGPIQPPQYAGPAAPAQSKVVLQDYQGPSVYDFLTKQGKAGDYQSRKALAQKLGMSGYKGLPEQNAQMMEMIRQNPDVLSDYSQAPASSSSQPRKSNVVKTKQPSQSKLPSSTTRYGMDYTGMPYAQVQKIGMPGSISFGSGSVFEQIPVNQPTRSVPKRLYTGMKPEQRGIYDRAFASYEKQVAQGKRPSVPRSIKDYYKTEEWDAALRDFNKQAGYKHGGEYGDYSGTYSAGVYYGQGGSFVPEFYDPQYGLPQFMYGMGMQDGGLVKGGEYDMTEEEIQNLIDQGYKIQYI